MPRLSKPMRIGLAVVAAPLAVYLVAVIVFFAAQRRLLHSPPSSSRPPRLSWATTHSGTHRGVPYLFLHRPSGTEDAVTLVYLHGPREVVEGGAELYERLRGVNVGMASIEFPGFGALHSDTSSEHRVIASADAALHELYRRGVHPSRTVLVGRSLGTGVAVALAARGHGIALVLISPHTSMRDVAAYRYPYLPARRLVRDPFDSAARAPRISVPTLVLHGDRDRAVPMRFGRELSTKIRGARFEVVRGAGHDDIFVAPSTDTFQEALRFGSDAIVLHPW